MRLFRALESIVRPREVPAQEVVTAVSTIDWQNPYCKLSRFFCVKEALWLQQWHRLATPDDGLTDLVKNNLILTFRKMDVVREFLDSPILVHSGFRPVAYNREIGGKPKSAHLEGLAVDWDAHLKANCDEIRKLIVPKLTEWQMRCERLDGSTWVHLDLKKPLFGNRYFKP